MGLANAGKSVIAEVVCYGRWLADWVWSKPGGVGVVAKNILNVMGKCPDADKDYCDLDNDLCDKNGNDNGLRKRCY